MKIDARTEIRVIAAIQGDGDPHAQTAAEIFNVAEDEVSWRNRLFAKRLYLDMDRRT